MNTSCRNTLAALGLGLAAFAPAAQAIPVALELQLLVDVSGSISDPEFALQRTGYANAFQDAGIQGLIASQAGGIAVQLIYWSSSTQQQVAVNWTQLTDAASATAFGVAIAAAARPFAGGTAPQAAMTFGTPLFNNNGFEGARLVMDVSGDGTGEGNTAGRDLALGTVDTINGLVISPTAGLIAYYNNNVIGGPGAQLFQAATFADFGAAVTTKIGREIVPVPEPGTLALLGFAGLAFGFARRRKV